MRLDRSTALALLFLALGLTAAGVWSNVVGYSVNLLPADALDAPAHSFNRSAFLWGRMISCALIMLFARRIPPIQATLIVAVSLTMSTATGAIVLSYHQTLLDMDLFASIGIFVSSCGYIFIVSIFYIYFAQKAKTEHAVACIAVSLVLETVLSVIVSLFLPPAAQACIVWLAPLAAALFYFLATRFPILHNPEIEPKVKAQGFEKNMLVAEVILFTVVMVLIRALSNTGIWGKSRTNYIGMMELSVGELVAIALAVFAMAYLVFILPRKRLTLFYRCIISLVVMVAGLQILALTSDLQFRYSFDTVTTAIELFSHLAKWMIVIECIRQTDIPPFRVASMSGPIYAIFSLAWINCFETLEFVTSTFVMVVVYGLFITVVVLLLLREKVAKDALTQGRRGDRLASASGEEISAFEDRWGLSARESQIFESLLLGKRRKAIEDEYGLSEGTVKTHITNIYRKLDVHSKKEMADLFERETDSAQNLVPPSN